MKAFIRLWWYINPKNLFSHDMDYLLSNPTFICCDLIFMEEVFCTYLLGLLGPSARIWGLAYTSFMTSISTDCNKKKTRLTKQDFLYCIVLGFNDTSTLVGHFVSSPREREKRDRRDSRRDEREEQGRKRNRNEREETEEIKTSPLYLYLLQW